MAACNVEDIILGEEWIAIDGGSNLTKVVIKLGRECRDWAYGVTNSYMTEIIQQYSQQNDYVIFTDGSVNRGHRSGWGIHCISKWQGC